MTRIIVTIRIVVVLVLCVFSADGVMIVVCAVTAGMTTGISTKMTRTKKMITTTMTTTGMIGTTALEQAQAKRERRANRKNPSKYALYNVTPEAEADREKFNERVAADRAAREAKRKIRELREQQEVTSDSNEHEQKKWADEEREIAARMENYA